MIRMSYKPRTHHRDGYHASATLNELTRNNGRDLFDVATATSTRPTLRRLPSLTRKLTDGQVAVESHYASLAVKYDRAMGVVA